MISARIVQVVTTYHIIADKEQNKVNDIIKSPLKYMYYM